MKFSCQKCAAKYQISDEKVSGRTVKMKCRKCGTIIPIRAQPSRHSLAAAPLVSGASLRPQAPADAPAPPGYANSSSEGTRQEAHDNSEEWHAGIAGASVGPMTISELKRRVADGSVNSETYVWHEGMDGWKQLPDVSELQGILETALLAVAAPSMPPAAKQQKAPPRAGVKLKSPASKPEAGALAPSPVMPAAIVAPQPLIKEASPLTASAETSSQEHDAKGLGNLSAPMPGDAPLPIIAMPSHGQSSHDPHHDSLYIELTKKRQNPLVIPFVVVAAVVFGLTMGIVFFGDQETRIIRQIVEVPAKVGEAMEVKRTAEMAAEMDESAAQARAEEAKNTAKVASKGRKTASAAPSTGSKKPTAVTEGLQGLSGLSGLGGPSNSGPSASKEGTAGGRPLSSSQIQKTVSTYRTGVKRGCWERALMTRDKSAPSSARVTVAISVSSSGSVTGAKTGGDPKGYRGLASCIAMRVRGWRFPRSSGSTTVNVPFVFASQ